MKDFISFGTTKKKINPKIKTTPLPALFPLDKLTEKTCNHISFVDLLIQTKFVSRPITATRLFRTLFILSCVNDDDGTIDQNDSNLDKKIIPVQIIYHFFQMYQSILEKFQSFVKNELLCHIFTSDFSSLTTPINNVKNMKVCYGMSRVIRFYDGNESHLGRLFITEKCVFFGMTTFLAIFDHDEIIEISLPDNGGENGGNLNITISKPSNYNNSNGMLNIISTNGDDNGNTTTPLNDENNNNNNNGNSSSETVLRFYFGRNSDAKIWEGYFQSLRAMREMEKNRRKLSITEAMENGEEEANLLLICMALNKLCKIYNKNEIVNPLRFYG